MDIVRDTKIDWLGLKWIFIGLSAVLILAGAFSLLSQGLNLGVDFTGGALVRVKFQEDPDLERIRQALAAANLRAEQVTRFEEAAAHEVQIRMAQVESEEADQVGGEAERVIQALRSEFDAGLLNQKHLDLNNASRSALLELFQERDPEQAAGQMGLEQVRDHYGEIAGRIIDLRTAQRGILKDLDELSAIELPPAVRQLLQENAYAGSFALLGADGVGPKIGQEMQERARAAIVFSLLGMLIYIAIRFRPIYALAAIVALFHDVFITLGFFSISDKEISLTVIAGFLTLVGYSINDTIVIFDRVRENLKLMRRSDMASIINASINQTLNRTILTSGMTFLAVFALYLLGGEVLSGFSFALVVGIIVGTYSSVAIASPIVLWWQIYSDRRAARA